MADNEDPFEAGDTNLFDSSTLVDPTKDYWTELVGDGKKYKDQTAAGRALAEKDAFIQRLQAETKGMREELTQRKTVAEMFDQLKELKTTPSGTGNQPTNEEKTEENSLTPEQLKELIRQELNQTSTEAQKQKNYLDVVNVLREKFGDNTRRVIAEKAEQLGVDGKVLKEMASDRPKMFLALFESVKESEADLFLGVAPKSSLETHREKPLNLGTRNKAYYDKLKKDNPTQFWTPAIQGQMHRDAIKLKEKFYN